MSIYDTLITHVSDPALKQAGTTAALGNYGAQQTMLKARKRRYDQLSALVQQGTVKSSQLGPNDRTLLASGAGIGVPLGAKFGEKPATGVEGILGKVGGFAGNLAKDIGNAGRYLPGGILKTAKALGESAWQDIKDPLNFSDSALGSKGLEGSRFGREIVKPTLEDYKATYLSGGGSFWKNFTEHPLGPILDAATLLSFGLAGGARVGAVAARAGNTGRLANLSRFTERAGREPLTTSTGRKLPRTYTARPLSRLGQKHILDPLAERIPALGNLQRRMEERRLMRGGQVESQHERFAEIADMLTKPDQKLFGSLPPADQQALFFLQLGVNTPRRVTAFEDMVKRGSLDDPRQLLSLEAQGIDKRYLEHQAKLPETVKQRILDPSDKMIAAHQVWKDRVAQFRDQIRAEDPEIDTRAAEHIARPQQILDDHLRALDPNAPVGGDVLPHPGFPIEPTYVPLSAAAGFEPAAGFRRPEGLFERPKGGKLGRAVGFGGRPIEREPATMRTGFAPQAERFLHESQFETFKAGTFRTDGKAMIDHITKRAKSNADKAFKLATLARIAVTDPDEGKLFKTKAHKVSDLTDEELRKLAAAGVDLNDIEFVNDGFMYQFFHKQYDHLERVQHVVDDFIRDLPDDAELTNIFADPKMEQLLEAMTDADAKAFITNSWNAAKTKNYVVPKAEAKYMMKMSNLDLPHTNAGMRFFGTWMNRWRNFVLTYMPRWWLNTAAGSFMLNVIQGVNPSDYMTARKWQKAGLMPKRVNLGHQPTIEYEESAAQFGRQMMPTVPTKFLQGVVQGIENHFRRAAFVHQLKREHRLVRDHKGEPNDPEEQTGQALEDMGHSLQEHYDEVLGKHKGNVVDALSDPQTVARALHEVDKFSYNYGILGPSERKWVRQFIPFWGWYKFISMAAYRLPVEMPGRVNVMRWLSNVAAEEEANMGTLPPWVKGAIPISVGGGRYIYLSSLGLNPFSQFFNPLGERGLVAGTLSPTQLNPALQAAMSAVGFDPLSGGGVRISPESGIGTDFLGRLVDENTGQPVNLTEREGGWRLLHSLLFSLPQARTGLSGETGQFPESIPGVDIPGVGRIPGIHDRPLPGTQDPVTPLERVVGVGGDAHAVQRIQELLGLLPLKDYDLSKQDTAAKAAKYVRKKNQRQRERNP